MPGKFIVLVIFIVILPFAYSNGGCAKNVGDMFVEMSSVPIAPMAGQTASYIVSFVRNGSLVNGEIKGTLKIVKNDNMVFSKSFKFEGGILDFKHTYDASGDYEIFLDYYFNGKRYEPEDYLIEVKEKNQNFAYNFAFLAGGIIIGMILTKLNFGFKIRVKK